MYGVKQVCSRLASFGELRVLDVEAVNLPGTPSPPLCQCAALLDASSFSFTRSSGALRYAASTIALYGCTVVRWHLLKVNNRHCAASTGSNSRRCTVCGLPKLIVSP